MPVTDKGIARSIRLMGQETAQCSTLTANHGTAVSKDTQLVCDVEPCVINVFKENETYYLFLIFAKESTNAPVEPPQFCQ